MKENNMTLLPHIGAEQFHEITELGIQRADQEAALAETTLRLRDALARMIQPSNGDDTGRSKAIDIPTQKSEKTVRNTQKTAASHFGRGELSKLAVAAITRCGIAGVAPKTLAQRLKCDVNRNILPWYYGTGNKNGVTRWADGPHKGNFVLTKFVSEKQ